jgi:hypothetical protein
MPAFLARLPALRNKNHGAGPHHPTGRAGGTRYFRRRRKAIAAAAATDDQIGSGTAMGWEETTGAGLAGTVGVAPESDADAPEPMRARASRRAADVGFMAGREGYEFLCFKDPRTGDCLLSMSESWNFRHFVHSCVSAARLASLKWTINPARRPRGGRPGRLSLLTGARFSVLYA